MNNTMFVVFLLLIVLMVTTLITNYVGKARMLKNRLGRGSVMSNEMLLGMIGKSYVFITGAFGTNSVRGEVLRVKDNWVEVRTSRGVRLVNTDFVVEIREMK